MIIDYLEPVLVPIAGFIRKLLFDVDLVDLALWIPFLSWDELALTAALITVWKLVAARLDALLMALVLPLVHALRLHLADGLQALAQVVRPGAS